MNAYILTIQDEPDNPIILNQNEFNVIYQAGITQGFTDSILKDDIAVNEKLTVEKENMVSLGTIEPKNTTQGYYYKGDPVSVEEVSIYFEKGIRYILQSFLDNHKSKD